MNYPPPLYARGTKALLNIKSLAAKEIGDKGV